MLLNVLMRNSAKCSANVLIIKEAMKRTSFSRSSKSSEDISMMIKVKNINTIKLILRLYHHKINVYSHKEILV